MKSTHHKGFTLIELMIVITIIGVLAAIALPNFITYRKRSYNTNALQDAKNSFTASQSYFNDHPSSSLPNITPLYSYGFKQTGNVTVLVSGTQSALQIRTYHSAGDKTYTIGSEGRIN